VKDYQIHLEKLRADAAECKLISGLATDKAKQELFDRLSAHLTLLADQVENGLGGSAAKPSRQSFRHEVRTGHDEIAAGDSSC